MSKKPVYCKFNSDKSINEILHEKLQSGRNVVVFPSIKAKLMYTQQYSDDQLFNSFLTMEELKVSLFIQNKSLIKGNRRIIALYFVCIDLLQKCNCRNFFDFVSFAIKYFHFMDECCEELVDIGSIDFSRSKIFFTSSQLEDIKLFDVIKNRYKDLCKSINYTDMIFMDNAVKNNGFLSEYNAVRKVIFAGYYCFSKREQVIVNYISNLSIDAEVIQQDIDFENHANSSIDVFKDNNSFLSFINMAKLLNTDEKCIIIDSIKNTSKHYQLLDQDLLSSIVRPAFSQTPFYELLSVLTETAKTIENTYEMKIQSLFFLKALSNSFIAKYYNVMNEKHVLYQKITNYINEGKLYIRESDRVLGKNGKLQPLWNDINQIVMCHNLSDISEFLAKIPQNAADSPFYNDFLDNNLIGNDWFTKSCEMLFEFIEELKSLNSFTTIIASSTMIKKSSFLSFLTQQAENNGSYLFTYILEFIALKEIDLDSTNVMGIQFMPLKEAINVHGKDVFICNAVEGILPKAKETVFLLNDEQRHMLGLKTYSDIREEEKYYFYLSILNNRTVKIFTYEDKDNTVSSFVEELLLKKGKVIIAEYDYTKENTAVLYSSLYKEILLPSVEKRFINSVSECVLFPFTPLLEEYIKSNVLTVHYYGYQSLINDPASFFLKFIIDLKAISFEKAQGISPLLIGKIVHSLFSLVNERLSSLPDINNIGLIKSVLNLFLKESSEGKNEYCDYFPDTMSLQYFEYVLFPSFENTFLHFYLELHKIVDKYIKTAEKYIDIINDSKSVDKEIAITENEFFKHIKLKGRADLILHAGNFDLIVDYKTGAVKPEDRDQLEWYSMLYQDYFNKAASAGSVENSNSDKKLSLGKTIGKSIFGLVYYLFSGYEDQVLNLNHLGSGDALISELETILLEIVKAKGFFVSDTASKQDKEYKKLYLMKSPNADINKNV